MWAIKTNNLHLQDGDEEQVKIPIKYFDHRNRCDKKRKELL